MIYLDYNATTPIDKEVQSAMEPYLFHKFGNPSSRYSYGIDAKKAIENARMSLANLIGANTDEIFFTGGGSEGNNHAIKGVAFANRNKGNHIIVSAIEHPSVLEVTNWLEKQGFEISVLPVDNNGFIIIEKLKELIRANTILISVMLANNEVGTIQPISKVAEIAKKNNILLHTDAAQAVGKINIDVNQLGVDILTIAGHKFYAPKGVGAIYIKRGTNIDSLIHGASQEKTKRAGTENLLEIVGIGAAADLCKRDLIKTESKLFELTSYLRENLKQKLPKIHIHTPVQTPENQILPNTLSVSVPYIEADTILSRLPNYALSAGAACHADGSIESTVLKAMQVPDYLAMGTIRISVGKYSELSEINSFIDDFAEVVNTFDININESDDIKCNDVNLTEYTKGLGCACKISPDILNKILIDIPNSENQNVIVGKDSNDDAVVYKISDTKVLIQTIDFFTPIVDNPYDFGAIAAANSLSDIYAMGGNPIFALNMTAFPINRLPLNVLKEIQKGGVDKMLEANVEVLGGHSIDSTEPKFGYTVSGTAEIDKIWRNTGSKVGDVLLLTKPIGTGIITTALKKKIIDVKESEEAINLMKKLNLKSAKLFHNFNIHACTDITGFGLIGHLSEMIEPEKFSFLLDYSKIPFLPNLQNLISLGVIPGGTISNRDFYSENVDWQLNLSESEKIVLFDSQTSGGLVVSVLEKELNDILDLFKENNEYIAVIGKVIPSDVKPIIVK